jgi:2-keto-4-pentenoate hydratase/2-oxohepta-3-ene-1,7-dioic acid hydratase in catechol pathway
MTISVLRTADAWWVKTANGAAPVNTAATSTAALLADRPAIDAAVETGASGSDAVAVDSLELISPVTKPCRVVAQMTNFESHVKDAGMDPESVPLTFFRKASASINGPFGDIVKPAHVRLLDYEVEIGLVIRCAIPVGTAISDIDLHDFIADWLLPTMSRRATSNFHRPSSTRPNRIQRSPRLGQSWYC